MYASGKSKNLGGAKFEFHHSHIYKVMYLAEGSSLDDPEVTVQSTTTGCREGHRSTLSLETEQGGVVCLICLSKLITNPRAPTFHVSYALSQLSLALSQPRFISSLLNSHPHFLVSPLVISLSSFDDDPIALQIVHVIISLCEAQLNSTSYLSATSLCNDFITQVAERISSGALAWSRRQVYMLHCFGILLSYSHSSNVFTLVKDRDGLFSNLVTGLQLPSEEIRGEILFVLYKLSTIHNEATDRDGTDFPFAFCPELLHLSLEALLKTENDDVRLNCLAFLMILVRKGFFHDVCSNSSYGEADVLMTTNEVHGCPLDVLFVDAVKGPLLSSDKQVQISTLDLIFHYLSWETVSNNLIQLFVEENIVDYVFEILRLSECKDPIVNNCILVLGLFFTSEKGFMERLVVGFSTLVPVLHYVAEVPFHPVQSQMLNLIWKVISDYPGIVPASYVEELAFVLKGMLKRHTDGEAGMPPETFTAITATFGALIKSPRFSWSSTLISSFQEAANHAVLACLNISKQDQNQLLNALYLLKEVYCQTHQGLSYDDSNSNTKSPNFIMEMCMSELLPWFITTINDIDEEVALQIMETFHFILLQDSHVQATLFGEALVSFSWFSFSFGCLGLFPNEKMKWTVYLMLSALVDVLLGENAGQPIRDAASNLPHDPFDMLFVLGQKSSGERILRSCQSAVFLILHVSSLYDNRLADEKSVLASLEKFILVNCADIAYGPLESSTMVHLINLYGLYRDATNTTFQIPYSPEAERIFFRLVNEIDWNMASSRIHLTSLKWLFQQERIIKSLSDQILKLCRSNNSNGTQVISFVEINKCNYIDVIEQLTASADNHLPRLLVCLLLQLVEEEHDEYDILSLVNMLTKVTSISPAALDQLYFHGIDKAICSVYCNMKFTSSTQLFKAMSSLLFTILCSAHPQALRDDDAWVTVTIKIMDYLITMMTRESWSDEVVAVILILSLILHHSTHNVLFEASKRIVFNCALAAAISDTIHAACSQGPALFDKKERTGNSGYLLVSILLLCYFSLRSSHVLFPAAVDWQDLLDTSNVTLPLSMINISCHNVFQLMYLGSPLVKLVASYYLLEFITRLLEQRHRRQEELKCPMGYFNSIIAVLKGLIFSSDIRVSLNCSLCLLKILELEKLEGTKIPMVPKNTWSRFIVEEMALSLSVPCLASKSFINYYKAAVHVAVAIINLPKPPRWISVVFDDPCICGLIENLADSTVNAEKVLLLRNLLLSEFLKKENVPRIRGKLQELRKQLCSNVTRTYDTDRNLDTRVILLDDLEKMCKHVIHLMIFGPSHHRISGDFLSANRSLSEEIELFFETLIPKND